ncbi:MAG: toxin-antitoxin system YwqK family antitoxin [Bacteroidota bacterium]
MKRYFFCFFLLLNSLGSVMAQKSDSIPKRFFYPNGALASEGYFVNEQSHGIWKTYYPDSTLKSLGLRTSGLTDSTWIFFDELGDTIQKVDYQKGEKHGYLYRYYFLFDQPNRLKSSTFYQHDKRERYVISLSKKGDTLSVIPFENDRKHGVGRTYKEGELSLLSYYRKDTLLRTEKVNQVNEDGEKIGVWVQFHSNGNVAKRNQYVDGLLHDVQYAYNPQGEVIDKSVFRKGRYLKESTSLFTLDVDIEKKYNEDSLLIFRGVYKDSVPIGIHRWYDSTGSLNKVRIYNDKGQVEGEGMLTHSGKRTGNWILFNNEGNKSAKGSYENNLREGKWQFFYPDGFLFQEGSYFKGNPEGLWTWYFKDQSIKCKENFLYGEHEGNYHEYDSLGNIIVQGQYVQGKREGEWIEKVGDFVRKGNYEYGQKQDLWEFFYEDGTTYFQGNYFQGTPDGIHKYYYPNGKVKEIRRYNNGRRIKNWVRFTPSGEVLLILTFEHNKVVRINGKKTTIPYE